MNHKTHDTCQRLLEGFSGYLDGQAAAAVCAEIEEHLAGCDNCQAIVDTLRKTILLYQRFPQPDLPEEARRRLYHRLDLGEFLAEK